MATLEAVPEKQSRRSGIVEFRQLSRTGTVRTLTLGESAGDHQPSPEVALDDWIMVARWRASGSPALQSSPGVNTVWQLAYREMQSRCAIPYQPRFRFSLTGALPSPRARGVLRALVFPRISVLFHRKRARHVMRAACTGFARNREGLFRDASREANDNHVAWWDAVNSSNAG